MTRLSRSLAAVLLLGGLAASAATTATAAAPWADSLAIPGAAPSSAPLVITDAGHGVAVAPADGSAVAPAGAVSELVVLGPDGKPSGPARGLAIADAQLATYASDRIVVAGSPLAAGGPHAGTIDDTSHVQVAFGAGAGNLSTARGLPSSTGEHVFALASNHAGDVAIVAGDTKHRRVWIRRRGGSLSFRLALTIKVSNKARDATVAVGPAGDVLAVWEDSHHVFTRHVGPSGAVGRRSQIGDGIRAELQAAVNADGRELVAWSVWNWSEGLGSSSAVTSFATAAPRHGFGHARQLTSVAATQADPPIRGVRLATGQNGSTVLALTTYASDTGEVAVGVAAVSNGHVGTVQELPGTSGADLGALAVGPDGSAIVLWRRIAVGHQELLASVSAGPGQAFGGPELVASVAYAATVTPTVVAGPGGAALALIPSGTQAPSLLVTARPPIMP